MKEKEKDKNIYVCMILCLLIGTAAFLYYIWKDGGVLILRDDFNIEQIPFLAAMNRGLKNPSGAWRWNVDLGTQVVGAYSFYNLGSPFAWLTFLFPEAVVPYLVGIVNILKYMVAGVTAYLYLRRFVQEKMYAVPGALLYAFSGFQSMNLLFHFHDVTAFFPLLLLGLEKMMEERKRALFVFAVFLNCLVNYFFFVGEVIFLIIYYLFRFRKRKEPAVFLKNGAACLLAGIMGVGMACILFLPSIFYILGSPRSGASLRLYEPYYYIGYILFAVKGFLLPGEAMTGLSCVVPVNYTSTACYLPMAGGSLAFAYMLKKKHDWLTKLLLFSWVVSCSPTLDSMFYLFTKPYKRWWFMFILMLALASVKVLDQYREYPVKKGVFANGALLVFFCACLVCLDRVMGTGSVIFRKGVFFIDMVIALSGLVLTYFWCCDRRKDLHGKKVWKGFLFSIAVFCSATTFYTLGMYKQNADNGLSYLNRYRLGLQLKMPDGQYRYDLADNVLTFPGEASGIGSFSSTVSNSLHEFNALFDVDRSTLSVDMNTAPGLAELLAARYEVTDTLDDGRQPVDTVVSGSTYYIVEKEACPIGFVQHSYMTVEELKRLPTEQRGVALLDNVVVDGEAAELAGRYLDHNRSLAYEGTREEIQELVARSQESRAEDFLRDREGFRCTASLETGGMLFFSVPYDDGWSAYVNDEEAEIVSCGGLMGLLLPAGSYNVRFRYTVPGLKAGMAATVVSFIGFALLLVWERKHSRNQKI